MEREAMFYEKLEGNRVKCNLCHHYCQLSPGQKGLCLNKINKDGKLYSAQYGKIITIASDPIEKKPLYHYYPGSEILSVAQAGCNLKCPFCQNAEISQEEVPAYKELSPEELKNLITGNNADMIAFTYTEPLMWYEYIYDFCQVKGDIKTVIVSNGNINRKPAETIAPLIDAANIDMKSTDSDFYAGELGGDLNSVKNTIEIFHDNDVHVEITILIIPGKTDNEEQFKELTDFIAGISPFIPLHISRYYPSYKYNAPPTPIDTLTRLYDIAKKTLHYAYIGNIPDREYTSTYCHNCGNLLIERSIYNVQTPGLENGRCSKCNTPLRAQL
ncbi:MAG: AmmeMemoRadiSam system radical SAM enzyme [candidate division WOR-3 bacterium]|nr:AmmeMemoRadiSam system radical SAM enzyme [candidate division WOR-3 bacterium]